MADEPIGAHLHDCLRKAHEDEDWAEGGPGQIENNANLTLQSLQMDGGDQGEFSQFINEGSRIGRHCEPQA